MTSYLRLAGPRARDASRGGQRRGVGRKNAARRSRRRPHGIELEQFLVDDRGHVNRMPKRWYAADRIAGDIADSASVRPFQWLAQDRRHSLFVDAVHA